MGFLKQMMNIINGESNISLRIIDWFVTDFAKKNYTVYEIYTKPTLDGEPEKNVSRFTTITNSN